MGLGAMVLKTIAAVVAVLAVLWTLAEGSAVAGDPDIRVAEKPSALRGRDKARVVARVDDAAACKLVLRTRVARVKRDVYVYVYAGSSARIETDGDGRFTWRWRVPTRTAEARWTGTIYCWRAPLEPRDATLASRDAEQSFSGRLHGKRRGRPALVDGSGLAATVKLRALDERQWLQKAADYASLVGLLGLAAILWTLFATKRQAQSERTQGIIERSGKSEFLGDLIRAMGFLQATDAAVAVEQVRRWEMAETHSEDILASSEADVVGDAAVDRGKLVTKAELINVANFYDEIGALWNLGKLERRLVQRSFGAIMPVWMQASWWWIQYQRDGKMAAARVPIVRSNETDTFCETERMVRSILRTQPHVEGEVRRPDRVRAVCLPPERCRDVAEWSAFGALSVTVSALLSYEKGLQRLEAGPSGPWVGRRVRRARRPIRTVRC